MLSGMPAKDFVHDFVKHALIKDGWEVTHDPYFLPVGKERSYVDLAAEKILIAEKGTQKIAVEIKSFGGRSDLVAFREALGQYLFYKAVMKDFEADRQLFLAVGRQVFKDFFEEPAIRKVWELYNVHIIVFEEETEEILQWII